ncbi:RPS27B-like protein [Saccharomyces kudriavzevii IFO 1802]|uniref:40S ribosomal protein S27 n=2 Tax=Saccharomyces TaxID=4930 RepID=J8TXK2_SACK1|nr:Rps27bp [Saccharomyces cerevisiae x Saccharomyces kudriavzevii VIN7]EJT44811.1 RPS27B-like protein [Saccharomyces kudriavzevii IFO 1802]
MYPIFDNFQKLLTFNFPKTIIYCFYFHFLLLQVLVQDLLHPTAASEARKHKLKTLVQGPRSYFLDVKCPGCLNITTVFSHAQTAVTCESCSTVLCTPTGGKAKLSEGTSFRRK